MILTETEMDLIKALEIEALDNIKEANLEIGIFLSCKETFNTQYVQEMSDYFITLAKYQIEEEYDNISRWRKESHRVCR